jgi:hypothetical protein
MKIRKKIEEFTGSAFSGCHDIHVPVFWFSNKELQKLIPCANRNGDKVRVAQLSWEMMREVRDESGTNP